MNKPSSSNFFMLGFIVYSGCLPFLILLLEVFGLIDTQSDTFDEYITLFQHLLIFAVPIAFYCIVTKNRLRDIVPHEPLSFKNIVLIVFIALFTIPLMLWVGTITDFFIDDTISDAVSDIVQKNSLGYLTVAIAVMPGIFEELMFRGMIMTGYKRKGLIKSSFAAALLFGIMHLSLTQLFYAAAAGVIFGILVHYSNSIYSSMLAHFIINGVQAVFSKLAFTYGDTEEMLEAAEDTPFLETFGAATLLLAFTLPVLIALMYVYIRLNKGKNIDYKYSLTPEKEFETDLYAGGGRIIDAPFIATIVFYAVYMAIMNFLDKTV